MSSFKNIILGSSFYSVGYAFSGGNTLICERTQLCDPIYYGTLRTLKIEFNEKWCPETKELFRSFIENGGINNGYLMPAHSEILLADFIKRKGISVLFGTDIAEITKNKITVVNNGGIQHLSAERIIDKRKDAFGKKRINVICTGNPTEIKKNQKFDTVTSFFPVNNRFILTFCAAEEIETNLFKMLITEHLANSLEENTKILKMAYLPYFEDALSCPFEEFDKGIKDGSEAE